MHHSLVFCSTTCKVSWICMAEQGQATLIIYPEFMPYVFQLFAALLEANSSATLSDYYKSLIPPIIMPSLWEFKGNVPALVRLLSSVIPRGKTEIAKDNQIEPILGIFQKLVSSKANESHGFDLLETIVGSFPP